MIPKPEVALDANAIARSVKRIAHEIAEHSDGAGVLVLIGIVRRGAFLAERIATELAHAGYAEIPVGTLDISSYRDDGKGEPGDPRLLARDIPFSLDDKRVVLVDDVLYTGRTVRAALDALSDLGRADSIQLAVLSIAVSASFRSAPTISAKTSRLPPGSGSTSGWPRLTEPTRS